MHEIIVNPKYVCKCKCHYKHHINEYLILDDQCCNNSYIKYINDDETIDWQIYNNILRNNKHDKMDIPYINFGEYVVKNKSDYDGTYFRQSL